MNDNQFAGLNGFVWWVGVVEDRQDPLKLGRCRVRIFGWHSENVTEVPTELLPWSQAMMPLNNSNPYTPKESDVVVGFFLDANNAQTPVMMGVLPGIPLKESNPQQGFNDQRSSSQLNISPSKLEDAKTHYPRHLDEPTTSRLARNQSPTQVDLAKNNVNSQIERNPSYNARYPYNNAVESESGHAFEIDDTPDNERINIFHRTGSHLEMRPDGSMQQKVLGNNTRIIEGDELTHIKGNKLTYVDGDMTYIVKGNVTFQVEKDFLSLAKNIVLSAKSKFSAAAGTMASVSGKVSSSLGGGFCPVTSVSGLMTTVSGTASLKLSGAMIDLTNGGSGTSKDAQTTTPTESATTAATSGSVVGEQSYAALGQVSSSAVTSAESAAQTGSTAFLGGSSIVDITKNSTGLVEQSPVLNTPWSGFNSSMVANITNVNPSLAQQAQVALKEGYDSAVQTIKNLPSTVAEKTGYKDYVNSQSIALAKWDVAAVTNNLKDYQSAASATVDAAGKATQMAVNVSNLQNDVISAKALVTDFCIGESAKQYVNNVKDDLKSAKEKARELFKNYSKSTTDMIENASKDLKNKINSMNEKSIDEWIDSHLYDNSCAACAQSALADRRRGLTPSETEKLLSECLYREYKAIRDRNAGNLPITSAELVKAKKKEC
jgi:hypothetical protein